MLSDAITPDPEMAALIQDIRAPHRAMLETELAVTESTLYRRGNFNGTFDDLICDAMLVERDAEICLSPGFRWGATVLPNQPITWEHIYDATAITYPACYRSADDRSHHQESWRMWPTTCSTPIPIISRAATWCGLAA